MEIKRCYAPFKVEFTCPTCGGKVVHDFSTDYLSYPEFGEPEKVTVYCHDEEGDETCATEITIVLDFAMKAKGKPQAVEV